jgi:hypothetical protein
VNKEREDSIACEMSRCVHFNGIQHDECKAGINYHGLMGTGFGCFKNLPCLGHDSTPCPSRAYPTREQAEAEVDEIDRLVNRVVLCIPAAKADAKSKSLGVGSGGIGSLPCPSGCGGTLRYSVASVNGHMHGACSTDGCVSWME